ncbi:hypothetical protein [Streptomyces boncukensis]|uniref:Integral membrane protein n=1 Tax=Streptomyces boncukensis TaxID=2711219 RepID=A0A6G4X7U6_9ACTN|nr:hypothetical protein [Streptomyces boncukensis]NGO73616.1 hypothetical protein [Streptomyces boncukensis]
MTTDRAVRAGRAAVFAAVCVLLAAVGHAAMSGTPLPWWALCGSFAVTGAAAWPLAGRERSRTAVTLAAVLVQAVLHSAFALSQALTAARGAPEGSGSAPSFAQQWASYLLCGEESGPPLTQRRSVELLARAGLGHHPDGPPPGGTHAAPATHAVDGMSGGMDGGMQHMAGMSPTGMLAAHLLAALLSGLWLAYGERAVFRLGRTGTTLLLLQLLAPLRWLFHCPLVPAPPPAEPHRDHAVARPRRLLLVHVITSRGPPSARAAV